MDETRIFFLFIAPPPLHASGPGHPDLDNRKGNRNHKDKHARHSRHSQIRVQEGLLIQVESQHLGTVAGAAARGSVHLGIELEGAD